MGSNRKSLPQGLRFEVLRRDDFTCQYCGAVSPSVVLHIDHIQAVAKGGTNDIENLITACADCNQGKGVKKVGAPRRALPSAAVNTSRFSLSGMFGHSLDDLGDIEWQYEVISNVSDDLVSVQLFSWLDGSPSLVKIVSLAKLSDPKLHRLYSSRDAWILYGATAKSLSRDTEWTDRAIRRIARRSQMEAS